MDRRVLIVLVLLAVLVLASGAAVATVRRVSALMTFTVVGGVVIETPAQVSSALSAKLGRAVTVEAAALATVIDSEQGGQPRATREAVAQAVFNTAGRTAGRVLATIAPAGRLGAQNAGNHYVSSARPPSREAVEIAEGVLSGKLRDQTGGAVQFDAPKAQRAALAKHLKGYRATPEELAAKRRAAGMSLVLLPGIAEEDFRMWRHARTVGSLA